MYPQPVLLRFDLTLRFLGTVSTESLINDPWRNETNINSFHVAIKDMWNAYGLFFHVDGLWVRGLR